MRRITIVMVVAFALVVTACTAGAQIGPSTTGQRGSNPTGQSVFNTGGTGVFAAGDVQPFASCTEFLDYAKQHALDRVGPYGLDAYGYGGQIAGFVDAGFEEVSADLSRGGDGEFSTTTAASAGGVKGTDYSGTNVQVAGIDEPDFVKTDGERIFVVAQGTLYWIDASGTPEIVDSMSLEGWGQQLFLSGDTLLVMNSGGGYRAEPFFDGGIASEVYPGNSQRTVLTEVDVSDQGSMKAIRTLTFDGTMLSSRMSDGSVRVVVRSQPTGFAWVFPEGSGIRSEQKAIDANKKIIEDSTLENWVPWYVLEDHETGLTSDGPLLGCGQVGYPQDFSGLSMMTVLSIDLEEGLEPGNGIGLLAEGQTVYASSDNLYVATAPWMAWPIATFEDDGERQDTLTTQIHMFDISDPKEASYVASGEVDGTLLSQWSMDEYEGTLRVVVTDQPPWGGRSEAPETSVVALQREDEKLVEVGSVGGLGKNERVFAVRFIQDKGYVVTFRQVDPLYVVDLSDPTNLEVKGELKINGYSSYLHPIGEDLLLGVGQDATDEGRVLGTQVSVFDVSDPANPHRLSRMTFDDTQSQAEWDTKAFLWWAPEGISVLPMQRWSWDERTGKEDFFSGATVLSVTPQRVKQLGVIEHPGDSDSECEECGYWTAPIMRSLVIGDTLFTISETGVLASDLESLEQIEWVVFK
ncbi:MAG: beta-propeller domain-containing protein [Acidimicrobiia bacterium]|nr:MAG: beta-propeller domain-containing protein [Acidimicrobiia bacterium]